MITRFEVPADKLAWHCDLSFLPFTCTADMTPLEDFIGQDRAIRAIEFGLGVNKPGFNIFVTGLTGTGKTSIIKAFLKKITSATAAPADAPMPEDWCYVYNFSDPDRPQALKIRRGFGKALKNDMEQLIQNLQREAKKLFESDDFAHQRQALIEQLQKKQQEMMEGLMEQANRAGFALRMTPSGIMLLPTKDGKPMQEADYLALPAAEKKQLEERRSEIEKQVEDTLRDGKKLEREIAATARDRRDRSRRLSRAQSTDRTQGKVSGLSQSAGLPRRRARTYFKKFAALQRRGGGAGWSHARNIFRRTAGGSVSSLPRQRFCR